ncbi:MAG: MFS transporter [Deltaproteobacteria bacterium]|nr:MAG: MFS transporter [Deltaproteobacteria bacterium]
MSEIRESMRKTLADSAGMRWGILLLVSFAMAVNYYFYDVLSPIQEELIKKLGLSEGEYGSIIAAYSIPNVFFLMAAIGGMICDRMGVRLSGVVFFGVMVVGAGLTWYGTTDVFNQGGPGYAFFASFLTEHSPAFKMMFLGFFLFGLGAETSAVIISKIVIKWFRGRELATALGINVGIARVASSLTISVGAWLADPVWNRPVLVGFIIMVSGFIAFLIYLLPDTIYERQLAAQLDEPEEPFRIKDALRLLTVPTFVYVVLLCVTFYAGVFPFMKYAVDLMQNKFAMDKQTAGIVVSVLPLAMAGITPLFGMLYDFRGKGATMMIWGSVLMVAGHGLLSLTSLSPYVALVLLGIAFSLVPAVMWPSLAKIVEEKALGSAYGITFTIQNLGLMAISALIGIVLGATNPGIAEVKRFCDQSTLDHEKVNAQQIAPACRKLLDETATTHRGDVAVVDDVRAFCETLPDGRPAVEKGKELCSNRAVYDYTWPILMLAIFGVIGVVFAFLLKRADRREGYGLELPNKDIKGDSKPA